LPLAAKGNQTPLLAKATREREDSVPLLFRELTHKGRSSRRRDENNKTKNFELSGEKGLEPLTFGV
jgi:hypothetical protein